LHKICTILEELRADDDVGKFGFNPRKTLQLVFNLFGRQCGPDVTLDIGYFSRFYLRPKNVHLVSIALHPSQYILVSIYMLLTQFFVTL